MKVELKNVKVELEVGEGKAFIHVNGQSVPVNRDVGVAILFGADKPTGKVPAKKVPAKRGCQSFESKKKLSASLKAHYRKKREAKAKKEQAKLAKPPAKPGLKKTSIKPSVIMKVGPKPTRKVMNGANHSAHVN